MITKDELAKQIDWEKIMPMERYAGGHDSQMKGLIKDALVVGHYHSGDWQGEVATCLRVPSGEYIIYQDSYGSCSGCDAWEDATDEAVKKMCQDLVYNCKIFNSLEEVEEFLSQEEFEDYIWKYCAEGLLKAIRGWFERALKGGK